MILCFLTKEITLFLKKKSNNLKESQNGDKIKRDLFTTTLLTVISLLFGQHVWPSGQQFSLWYHLKRYPSAPTAYPEYSSTQPSLIVLCHTLPTLSAGAAHIKTPTILQSFLFCLQRPLSSFPVWLSIHTVLTLLSPGTGWWTNDLPFDLPFDNSGITHIIISILNELCPSKKIIFLIQSFIFMCTITLQCSSI